MTKDVYERLKGCAELLEDKKLIAKLSAGDLVAQEAKYHLNCLTTVYNRERAFFRQQRENDQMNRNDMNTVEHLQNLLHIS